MKTYSELKSECPELPLLSVDADRITIESTDTNIDKYINLLKNIFQINQINFYELCNERIHFYGRWLVKSVTQKNICILLGIDTEFNKYNNEIKILEDKQIWIFKDFKLTGRNICSLEDYLDCSVCISADENQNIILSW